VQRKSISNSSASAFNAKNADIPFSIRWIHNCFMFKRDDVFDSSKIISPFPCVELFSWFKRIEKSSIAIWAIWQSTCCQWIVKQNCDSVLLIIYRCHCVRHSPQHLSSSASGCSNEINVHCVLPPSRHTKHQINECVMDGSWFDWQQMKYIWKLSDLKFLSCLICFSAKKTIST